MSAVEDVHPQAPAAMERLALYAERRAKATAIAG